MFIAKTHLISRFRRNEDGTLVIFGLMLAVLMLMMGGFIVDLMRYETTRTKLWNTLDRASLAATALTQKLDRETVARDYMLKAGLGDALERVSVTQGANSAIVQLIGRVDTHPMFLHMLGIDGFDAVGRSQAEQSITNLEIALVLDVSGSMTGTKIANLKIAADKFVDTILENDPNHHVSISIVPYNAQVNIGPDMVSKFNITDANHVDGNNDGEYDVNCVEIPAEGFDTLALSQNDPMPMMAYADIAYNTNKINGFVLPTDTNYAKPNFNSTFCKPTTVNVVRLPNNNAVELKSQIDALQAGGNTSITLGMKWGATMLDPSMRPAYNDLINQGKIPANIANRPFAYNDSDAMKIIVLMTDGEHVSHDRVLNGFKTGPSPIYRSIGDGNYSIAFARSGTTEYYVPHLNTWQATAWDSGTGTMVQDWRDVWSNLKMSYVAWQFYARALGTDSASRSAIYTSQMNLMRGTYASVPDMDASLSQTCNLVKADGVVVYGIAVEAPAHGQDVISACASSPVHYFEATSSSIVNAFATIASNITMLKLTQ